MPKVIWCGNKSWESDFPESALPDNAVKINRPDDIFKSSVPYGILPFIISFAIIATKWFVLNERAVNPIYMPIGIIIGLLLMPVHEILHAICYGNGQRVYIGICLKKFAAFAVCHEPIKRKRFIVMSLMPILLGIIPLTVFFILPPNALLSEICIPAGIIGMLSPMPDYMDVSIILKQVPKGAFVHTQNDGFYWHR